MENMHKQFTNIQKPLNAGTRSGVQHSKTQPSHAALAQASNCRTKTSGSSFTDLRASRNVGFSKSSFMWRVLSTAHTRSNCHNGKMSVSALKTVPREWSGRSQAPFWHGCANTHFNLVNLPRHSEPFSPSLEWFCSKCLNKRTDNSWSSDSTIC